MVNAGDDDEYIQLDDIWTIQAYRYWQSYGLTADTSHQYTDTYTSNGSFTYGASISMSASSSGSESGSIAGSFALEFEQAQWTGAIYVPKSVDVTITPDSGQTGAMSYPQFGCVYNAQSTSSSAVMTCTAQGNSVFTQDTYTMELNTLGDTGGYGGLAAYIRPSGGGEAVGTITATNEAPFHAQFTMQESTQGSGQFSGNGTISMTTTTVNTNSLTYAFPVMKGNISSNLGSGWSNPKLFCNDYKNENWPTLIFLTKTVWTGDINSHLQLWSANGQTKLDNTSISSWSKSGAGYQLWAFKVWSTSIKDYVDSNYSLNGCFQIKWTKDTQNQEIIPIYVGYWKSIPDDLYRYVFRNDRDVEAINKQIAADQEHHDQMMDTSESSKIQTDGDALVNDADEKFGDLFFPLNHAIETANDLANVNATGVIRLPAIFADGDYWFLDLTQIEKNLPQAWSFIQSLCQLAVSIYLIHGLYSLFFGGKEDDS